MKCVRICLFFLIGMLCHLNLVASFNINDINYNVLSETDKTVEITQSPLLEGNVVIPETVMWENVSYTVISIGKSAFRKCALETVKLPNTLKKIDNLAFQDCELIKEMVIPESVEEMGSSVFSKCVSLKTITILSDKVQKVINIYPGCSSLEEVNITSNHNTYASQNGVVYSKDLKTLCFCPFAKTGDFVVPETTTAIGYAAFRGCANLTSITLPYTIDSISNSTFSGCTSLKSIVVSADNPLFTSLGGVLYSKDMKTLLNYPPGLAGVHEIPNSVETIGENAFYACDKLTGVKISNSLKRIGANAFYDCDSLKEVVIPNSVEVIENSAFERSGLEYVKLSENLEIIPDYAFRLCSLLTKVTIPESVRYIGDNAFRNTAIKSISIPNDDCVLNGCAFLGCGELESITLPKNLQIIESSLLAECRKLTKLEIPKNVKVIEAAAFSGCSLLKDIIFPDNLNHIGKNVLYQTAWYENQSAGLVYVGDFLLGYKGDVPEKLVIPEGIRGIAGHAFFECNNLREVSFPSTLVSVGGWAFRGTAWLDAQADGLVYAGNVLLEYKGDKASVPEVINVPDGVKGISGMAFRQCSKLKEITIPNSVEYIGDRAFEHCAGLTKVNLPDGIIVLLDRLFGNCISLTELTLPASVSAISYNAINCKTMPVIKSLATTPPATLNLRAKDGENTVLYVPASSITAYQSALFWRDFGSILPLTTELDFIDDEESIVIKDGKLSLVGAEGKNVSLYNLHGKLINELQTYEGEEIIVDKGVYVIQVGNHSTKIMVD